MHHQPCCGARSQKNRAEVEPVVKSQTSAVISPKLLIVRAAHIVDQYVDAVVRGRNLRERVVYLRFLRHVSEKCERRRSRKLVSRLRQSCGVEIEQRKRRALIRESPCYSGTNAVRCTGDDDAFSVTIRPEPQVVYF